jgi:hypothetical protein
MAEKGTVLVPTTAVVLSQPEDGIAVYPPEIISRVSAYLREARRHGGALDHQATRRESLGQAALTLGPEQHLLDLIGIHHDQHHHLTLGRQFQRRGNGAATRRFEGLTGGGRDITADHVQACFQHGARTAHSHRAEADKADHW